MSIVRVTTIPDQPIVYQMGKVGSVAVQVALRSRGFRSLHVHNMVWEDGDYYTPTPGLLEAFQTNREQIFKIVTLVREPVGRNVSAYFQRLHDYYKGYQNFTIDGLRRTFLTCYDKHICVLRWFDKEFKATTGIDIYQEPFVRGTGYQLYIQDNFRVLLIRTEDLDRVGAEALAKLTERSLLERNLKPFRVGHHNVLVDKGNSYGDPARAFYANVELPDWYLEQMYNSKFARHFYTDKELEAFSEYWRNKRV